MRITRCTALVATFSSDSAILARSQMFVRPVTLRPIFALFAVLVPLPRLLGMQSTYGQSSYIPLFARDNPDVRNKQ
jgi:hypothetical protein